MVATSQFLVYVAIVAFLVLVTVGDTVLIAILMYCFNRNNPPNCDTDAKTCTNNTGAGQLRYTEDAGISAFGPDSANECCSYNGATNEDYAMYINQATGLTYCFVSIPLMLYRHFYIKETFSSKQKPLAPWYIMLAIGCMNGLGNFCAAVGQVHTRGEAQAILNTFTIPVVVGLSWLFLRKRPSLIASAGAVLIVAGAAMLGLGHVGGGGSGTNKTNSSNSSGGSSGGSSGSFHQLWYSVVLYAFSTLFFGGEKVFEESVFKKYRVDVILMLTWTMWTQTMLGWVLYPLQHVNAFGGINIRDIPALMVDGTKCVAGHSSDGRPYCDGFSTAMFFIYCTVDLTCYGFGLYVIRRGGANLMILASALAMPLSQVMFAFPKIVGQNNYSSYHVTDGIALALTLIGFVVYQVLSPEGKDKGDNLERERSKSEAKKYLAVAASTGGAEGRPLLVEYIN